MLPFLAGKVLKNMSVFRVAAAALILRQVLHLFAVAAAQLCFREAAGGGVASDMGPLSGDQGINSFQAGTVGLFFFKKLPQ